MDALSTFFDKLWRDYIAITPQALAIHKLFEQDGVPLINDHVAFRTFSDSSISISALEPQILTLGYKYLDRYVFTNKKLLARCYVHPKSKTKIFISELQWKKLSANAIHIIDDIINDIEVKNTESLTSGRLWPMPTLKNYQTLLAESEYAAWLSVWGLRANHFTIFVNFLKKYSSLQDVVDTLLEQGYKLNTQGGVIKGTKQDLLIQASTMADQIEVTFAGGHKHTISSCYYEFAQRFEFFDGGLFQGFVTGNADKIFESTDSKLAL